MRSYQKDHFFSLSSVWVFPQQNYDTVGVKVVIGACTVIKIIKLNSMQKLRNYINTESHVNILAS